MKKINIAHIRERSTHGTWINFVVFDADSIQKTPTARAQLLAALTIRARANRLRVDQSALAFIENGQLSFYGTTNLVDYLSKAGLPQWTHQIGI